MLRFHVWPGQIVLLSLIACAPLYALADADPKIDEEEHEHAEVGERVPVKDVPPAEAVVEINGLVCSFCAFGAEKSVKRLPFLDSKRFNSGVEVDINKHQMRLALKQGEAIDYKRLALSLRAAGYEPLDIYLRVSGQVARGGSGMVLSGPGFEYALEEGDPELALDESVQLLIRIDGRELHKLSPDSVVRAYPIKRYAS